MLKLLPRIAVQTRERVSKEDPLLLWHLACKQVTVHLLRPRTFSSAHVHHLGCTFPPALLLRDFAEVAKTLLCTIPCSVCARLAPRSARAHLALHVLALHLALHVLALHLALHVLALLCVCLPCVPCNLPPLTDLASLLCSAPGVTNIADRAQGH